MTASHGFFFGDVVVIDLTISVESTATNPGAVVFSILPPDGTVSNPTTIDRTGTGAYGCEYETFTEGWHRWRATGTTPAAFAREGTFYVHGKTLEEPESQPET